MEDSGTQPSIATSKAVYSVGEPIVVIVTAAPGDRWDWVSVYRRGADPATAAYLLWAYTGAAIDGSATLDRAASGPWPLRPGEYSAYLLKDDLYVKIAAADFAVAG